MVRRNKVKNGTRDYFYYCAASQTKLYSYCVGTYIHEIPLLEAVMEDAGKQIGRQELPLDMLDGLIEKKLFFPAKNEKFSIQQKIKYIMIFIIDEEIFMKRITDQKNGDCQPQAVKYIAIYLRLSDEDKKDGILKQKVKVL